MGLAIGIVAVAGALVAAVFLFAGAVLKQEPASGVDVQELEGSSTSTVEAAKPRGPGLGEPEEIAPLMKRLGALASKLSPKDYNRRLQHRLDLAGNPPN